MSSEQLNVIALVSGGKDSFFSALHCQRNGHRLVALANLFPAAPVSAGSNASPATVVYKPNGVSNGDHVKVAEKQREEGNEAGKGADDDVDLNSFMYQTVGHQVIPLYADATGLPLYRQPIYGGAKYNGRDYDSQAASARNGDASRHLDADETESMVPLLRAIMADYPEANALCAGAILSTYQRTRVESVALRLGLTPLAYLWKYPALPPVVPGVVEDAQLLHDMAAAGLDARVIKVASAGLDDDFLWEKVSSISGASRVKRALRKFGAAEGSVIGEGGEFETLVLDGPPSLFHKAIEVPESGRRVVREGGGTSWLSFKGASVREKPATETDMGEESCSPPRVPDVLDPRFRSLLDSPPQPEEGLSENDFAKGDGTTSALSKAPSNDIHWSLDARVGPGQRLSVEQQTEEIVRQVRERLATHSPPLPTTAITNTIIALSSMSDFPVVNKIYSKLFQHPNPPSRVTISCGDLQEGSAINIHLTIKPRLEHRERNGLHVQSRSYWAPANIGPYSQAIDVPLVVREGSLSRDGQETIPTGTRSVTIAGQIPLVPASMVLPVQKTGNLEMQVVLSLQHLWRIAAEMKVQLWTSAVAYFPQTPEDTDKRRQSRLAAAAWKGAHAPDEDEDADNEGGPDLWDRKFNPAYMSLGDDAAAPPKLPDWSVVKGVAEEGDGGDGRKPVPPFFAVEVEELPRQAGVEWHAHLGISGLAPSSVEYQTFNLEPSDGEPFYRRVCHFVVSGRLVHTTICWLARRGRGARSPSSLSDVGELMRRAYLKSIGGEQRASEAGFPYLMYLNVPGCPFAAAAPADVGKEVERVTAYVKAKSIYDENGEFILAIGLWK